MRPSPFKAMILAAGFGERMRPLTDHTPKPLLMAGGKTLIVWQIERLRGAGFVDLVINHAHLGRQIEDYLGDGTAFGVRIQYSREAEPLETAGGIANARDLLGDAPFLVTNGDVYAEFDYASVLPALADMASNSNHRAHLILVDNPPHHPGGDFSIFEGKVSPQPKLTFSGIGCYRPDLFADIAKGHKAKLAPLLKAGMDVGSVTGAHFSGRWEDVGTPARLASLDVELTQQTGATS